MSPSARAQKSDDGEHFDGPDVPLHQLATDKMSDDEAAIYAELDAELDAPEAKGWGADKDLVPGDRIAGRVKQVGTADTGGFGAYPLVTIETKDGERVALHCFHTVVQEAIKRQGGVQVHDYFAMQYNGKVSSKKGGPDYEDYKVIIRKMSSTVSS